MRGEGPSNGLANLLSKADRNTDLSKLAEERDQFECPACGWTAQLRRNECMVCDYDQPLRRPEANRGDGA